MIERSEIKKPLISVIIPTLNSASFLRECLESVSTQIYPHIEVILVDGHSTDETERIAQQFERNFTSADSNNTRSLHLHRQTSKGLAAAWNEGISYSHGDFIAFLDSDDVWLPGTLDLHVAGLRADEDKLATIGCLEYFLHEKDVIPVGFKRSLLDEHHVGFMPGCFMGRRSLFDMIGMFETRWTILSDIVWFDHLKSMQGQVIVLDDVVLRKRVHDANLSYTTAETPAYKKELLLYLSQKLRSESRDSRQNAPHRPSNHGQ